MEDLLALDKQDYKDIGGIQNSIVTLNKAIEKLTLTIEKIGDNSVPKDDYVDLKATVKSHDRTLKYFYGIAVGVLYILNFVQNGGINSIK